jgi:hypothetical protein
VHEFIESRHIDNVVHVLLLVRLVWDADAAHDLR